MDTGQRRAKAGGEFGPNREWYRGGQYIANTDTPKSPPPAMREPSPEYLAWKESEITKGQQRIARGNARKQQFAEVIAALSGSGEFFYQSLAGQIGSGDRLSCKQAQHVCRFWFGRQTKKNISAWDDLYYGLIGDES